MSPPRTSCVFYRPCSRTTNFISAYLCTRSIVFVGSSQCRVRLEEEEIYRMKNIQWKLKDSTGVATMRGKDTTQLNKSSQREKHRTVIDRKHFQNIRYNVRFRPELNSHYSTVHVRQTLINYRHMYSIPLSQVPASHNELVHS